MSLNIFLNYFGYKLFKIISNSSKGKGFRINRKEAQVIAILKFFYNTFGFKTSLGCFKFILLEMRKAKRVFPYFVNMTCHYRRILEDRSQAFYAVLPDKNLLMFGPRFIIRRNRLDY